MVRFRLCWLCCSWLLIWLWLLVLCWLCKCSGRLWSRLLCSRRLLLCRLSWSLCCVWLCCIVVIWLFCNCCNMCSSCWCLCKFIVRVVVWLCWLCRCVCWVRVWGLVLWVVWWLVVCLVISLVMVMVVLWWWLLVCWVVDLLVIRLRSRFVWKLIIRCKCRWKVVWFVCLCIVICCCLVRVSVCGLRMVCWLVFEVDYVVVGVFVCLLCVGLLKM